MIRSGLPIQQGVAEVVSKDAVTHDMRHLVLRMIEPAEIKFFPGQYMDIAIPGTDAVRSFSMANTSSRESGLLEFVIKVYPDGQFSEFLAEKLAEGDRLDITGPFGVFTLREGDNDLVFVGGGAGMAPILALLRTMAERGLDAQGHLLLRRADQEGPVLRGRAARAGGEAPGLPLHPGPVRAGRRRGLGRRDRPDHRCGQAARQRPARGTRLRVRAAAHGGSGAPAARHAGRGGKAHLLRQVHHHR